MKVLQKEFIGSGEVKGHKFSQIKVNSVAYIYQVDTGNSKYYEVFLRRSNPVYNREYYPRSSSFGIYAWTYPCLGKANKKFKEIEAHKFTENLQAVV